MPRRREFRGICPRCGRPYNWIESYVVKGRRYYRAVHYEGCVKKGNKVRRIVKRCYLGPQEYIYTSVTHPFMLRGAVSSGRLVDYLKAIADYMETIEEAEDVELEAVIKELEKIIVKLKRISNK